MDIEAEHDSDSSDEVVPMDDDEDSSNEWVVSDGGLSCYSLHFFES